MTASDLTGALANSPVALIVGGVILLAVILLGRRIDVKVGSVHAQLTPNGGSSVRDAIDRIEDKADTAVTEAQNAVSAAQDAATNAHFAARHAAGKKPAETPKTQTSKGNHQGTKALRTTRRNIMKNTLIPGIAKPKKIKKPKVKMPKLPKKGMK